MAKATEEQLAEARRILTILADAYPLKADNKIGIISHPLTSFGVYMDAEQHLVQITPENEVEAKAFLIDRITERPQSITSIILRCHKPYWVTLASHMRRLITDEREWGTLVKYVWINTEFPHQTPTEELLALFEGVRKDFLMEELDYADYEKLPEEMTVYRGLQGPKAKVRGLSWTLDPAVASWFAQRFNKAGRVFEARIRKKDVLFFTDACGEKEVVLNPRKLRSVKAVEPVAPVRPSGDDS